MDDNLIQMSGQTIDQIKKSVMAAKANFGSDLPDLAKAYTTSLGLVGYNLEAPAKQLVPFYSPMRNRIPRVVSKTGTSVNWKIITAVNANGKFTGIEGTRTNGVTTTLKPKSADFKIFGLQDSVTFEAVAAGKNFQDPMATASINLLSRVMTEEEKLIMGGNRTALTQITAPAATPSPTGGTIAAGTYSIKVAPLTLAAFNRILTEDFSDNQLLGVPAQDDNYAVITNALDGVGAVSSATQATTTGATSSIGCTAVPVKGAMAYAWFAGTAGNESFQGATVSSAANLTAITTGGTKATACSVDGSGDDLSYDGIIPQVLNNGGFFLDMANKSLTGAKGGVNELDAMNMMFYKKYKVGPSRYLVGVQAASDITALIVAGAGGPLMLVNGQQKDSLIGNYLATQYINKAMGGQKIAIEVHPWLPANMIVALTEVIPYANANIPSAFEIELGYDYMQLEYGLTQPKKEFEIRGYGALKVYFPASCGVICNTAPIQ